MNKCYSILHALLLLTGFSVQALAGPCDAYYRFDGNLRDEGGNNYAGQMIGTGGTPATAEFVEGRFGQALKLDGRAAMRAFIDLGSDRCPQVTVSAWIKIEPEPNQAILGTDSRQWLFASGSGLNVRTAGKDLWAQNAIYPNAGWMFVAAVWDHESRTHQLHWRGRKVEGDIGASPDQPKPAIWIGAHNDSLHFPAKDLVIDELRIVGRALDAEAITAMRDEPAAGGMEVQPAMVSAAGQACISHDECPADTYCAIDGTCHPDSHLPMQSAAGGKTLEDIQAEMAERNAGRAVTIDYDPPTNLLQNAGSGNGDGRTLADFQEQAAARNADLYDDIDYKSPTALLEELRAADAERRANAPEEEPPPPQDGSSDPPRVSGWRLSDTDVYQTPVSGKGGEVIRVLDMEDRTLSGIEIFEPNNVPCFIRLHAAGDSPGKSVNECTSTIIPVVDMSVWNEAIIDPAAITSARVCHSFQGNDRVKGILVSGYMIEEDGSMGFYQQDQGDGPNCSRWQSVIYCNSGYVASGIVAHFKDRDLSDSLTGLQLICRKVQKIYD